MEIKITTDANVVHAAIVGEEVLSASNVGVLKAEIAAKIPPAKSLVLSLAAIHVIDSAGVGGLVTILRTVRKGGGRLAFVGINPQVLSVLEMIRLTTVFEIYPDEKTAAAALAPTPAAP